MGRSDASLSWPCQKAFAQYGYLDANIGELARASEVMVPMLYKHFQRSQLALVYWEFTNNL
ncbi:MAG: hypothetical protein NVS4B1_33660 [Ktedonobacteraceae bacterium]